MVVNSALCCKLPGIWGKLKHRAFFMEGAYEKRAGNIGGWKRSFQLATLNYE